MFGGFHSSGLFNITITATARTTTTTTTTTIYGGELARRVGMGDPGLIHTGAVPSEARKSFRACALRGVFIGRGQPRGKSGRGD